MASELTLTLALFLGITQTLEVKATGRSLDHWELSLGVIIVVILGPQSSLNSNRKLLEDQT